MQDSIELRAPVLPSIAQNVDVRTDTIFEYADAERWRRDHSILTEYDVVGRVHRDRCTTDDGIRSNERFLCSVNIELEHEQALDHRRIAVTVRNTCLVRTGYRDVRSRAAAALTRSGRS